MNRQLLQFAQFIFTVGGAFAFGYKGLEYTVPNPTFLSQIILGLTIAAVVAVADMYFLIKNLN